MIDESDPVVRAMKAQFDAITATHQQSVTDTAARYEQGEEQNRAYQDELARREQEMLAGPLPEEPKNPWLTRRTMPPRPRPDASDDGTETGYYSNTWMQ
jgi:hypothetical protein